ncbi:hypothetical protein P7K49_026136 [Saguinus oedipus]|uniref:Uncharacterized protein n=1 Tax=Saguinus oedipus TaxID=9490 RepID=A0ABQ9ULI5_SAGOE|nr:hypothetical protein P7K49_026136 [Saguinus oedipus]
MTRTHRKDVCDTFLLSENETSHSVFSASLLTDGVFGRCQKVPAMDFYRYEVSPVALQRLRVALQKLSSTGAPLCCRLCPQEEMQEGCSGP